MILSTGIYQKLCPKSCFTINRSVQFKIQCFRGLSFNIGASSSHSIGTYPSRRSLTPQQSDTSLVTRKKS